MTDWLVNVADYACLPEMLDDPAAAELVRTWRVNVGSVRTAVDADKEDWIEQAARLHAAVEAFGSAHIWLTVNAKGLARNLATGAERSVAELANLPRWGSQPRGSDHSCVDDYWRLKAFQRHAGRSVTLHDSESLPAAMHAMAVARRREAFVKTTIHKYGIYRPALNSTDPRHPHDDADLGWAMVHLEGRPESFMLQPFVQMRHEYRFFVVGHQVVTGAGCVESFTPLDNKRAFDWRTEHLRSVSDTVSTPGLVSRYLNFARSVVDEIAVERPELGAAGYTLDVALGPDRKPLVIELNGLLNSGLYASDPRRVTDALRRTAQSRERAA